MVVQDRLKLRSALRFLHLRCRGLMGAAPLLVRREAEPPAPARDPRGYLGHRRILERARRMNVDRFAVLQQVHFPAQPLGPGQRPSPFRRPLGAGQHDLE